MFTFIFCFLVSVNNANRDPLTVFVENLDYKLTEMKIRDVFSEVRRLLG